VGVIASWGILGIGFVLTM